MVLSVECDECEGYVFREEGKKADERSEGQERKKWIWLH